MYEFRLPDVGEGIHEAELVEWMVEVGSMVGEGASVAVVNTDKVSVELPAPVAGVVQALPWEPGDIVQVGQVLMVFDDGDASCAGSPGAAARPLGDQGDTTERSAPSPSQPPATSPADRLGRPVAAPSTRKLAAELGVDLAGVSGSGPAGRILRVDVERAADASNSGSGPTDAPGSAAGDVVRERLTGARAVMHRHMAESSSRLATTTSTFTVRAEALEQLVDDLRVEADDAGPKIGVLAVASACVVRALTRNPRFNATVDDTTDDLLLHRGVHLGVAVASPSGLVVPVVGDAQRLRLTELAESIGDLALRARSGDLPAADLRGGSFTLSSTGGLERGRVTSTQPIVNLPQVAIMWMSRIRDEPVVEDGALRPGRLMSCSLSFDHRYIDGAEVTNFINDLTELLEHPVRGVA